ncbi:hypothetical protein D5047_21855 [Verminephrobacter eiseniae]|nr:hypothetical protein [Verminephrobacter eiseniae]
MTAGHPIERCYPKGQAEDFWLFPDEQRADTYSYIDNMLYHSMLLAILHKHGADLLDAPLQAFRGSALQTCLRIATAVIKCIDGSCRIPDDCIDSKRYPLFMARAVLQELIESLQSTPGSVKPC